MRILEIKNSLIKISYDVEDNLALSGFVIVEDTNSPYVAQVVNLKAENGRNFAVLKLLFTFNQEGVLKPYDGTIPSLSASVTKLPSEELLSVLPAEEPVYLGLLAQQNVPFKLDSSVFQSNLLICSNNVDNTSKILSNILPQLVDQGDKVVLLDVNGDFSSEDNFIFGRNFKLPLTSKFIDYIFENDLDGVEPVSKAIIQDIFKEVQYYLDTLPEGFIPIDTFINVVQGQYEETRIAELVLLQNKLLKYQENNVFVTSKDDASMFRSKVAHSDSLIVDISDVDVKLQKLLIPYMFDCISTVNSNTFVLMTINNEVADKKLLRKTLEFGNIFTTIICPHEFKYLPDLKQIIQNLILFAPQTLQHDFANYNTFLSKLNEDEFIVYGPATQQMPFIVQVMPYDELVKLDEQEDQEEVEVGVENQDLVQDDMVVDTTYDSDVEAENSYIAPEVIEVVPEAPEEMEEDVSGVAVEDDEPAVDYEDNSVVEENISATIDVDVESDSFEQAEERDIIVTDVPIYEEEVVQLESDGEDFFVPFQQDETDVSETYETSSFEQEIVENREILEQQVAEDVDAAFYRKIDEDNINEEDNINPDIFLEDENVDELSESDLDYIQSIPVGEDVQEVYSGEDFETDFVQPDVSALEDEVLDQEAIEEFDVDNSEIFESEEGSQYDDPQMVPIYTPDEFSDEAVNEAPLFESGDIVSHPKYGQGVVEKMINYGNKTLCSISFVNIGRRLLDPNLSELKLMSRDGVIVNN